MNTPKMEAITSIRASAGRAAVKRGSTFTAKSEQDARDLERMGQARRVKEAAASAARDTAGKAGK